MALSQNDTDISLKEKVNASSLIIEGKVIKKECFYSNDKKGNGSIYTNAKIKVSKLFKGTLKDTVVDIIYKGGGIAYGNIEKVVHVDHGFSAGLGDEGVFLLIPNNLGLLADTSLSYVLAYGRLGFVQYHPYEFNTASCFNIPYGDVEKEVLQEIESITGQKREVLGLNMFEKKKSDQLKKKIEVKAYKSLSGPCDQENGPCTIIDYAFANVNLSANGQILDFDIVSRDK